MGFLLDTNVLSDTRKRAPDTGVRGWLSTTRPDELHLSVLTVGEIRRGIALLRLRGDGRQAAPIERWLGSVVDGFENRVLPVTSQVAAVWGQRGAKTPRSVVDGLIAATAKVHGLTVVTRNVKDFAIGDVQVLNPFARD